MALKDLFWEKLQSFVYNNKASLRVAPVFSWREKTDWATIKALHLHIDRLEALPIKVGGSWEETAEYWMQQAAVKDRAIGNLETEIHVLKHYRGMKKLREASERAKRLAEKEEEGSGLKHDT